MKFQMTTIGVSKKKKNKTSVIGLSVIKLDQFLTSDLHLPILPNPNQIQTLMA